MFHFLEYLFIHLREKEVGEGTEGKNLKQTARQLGSLTWGSIP